MEEVRGLVKALGNAQAPEAVADVLKALSKAPVTVPILHELKCGAIVSKLRKHGDATVASQAKALIKQWKGLATAAGVPRAAPPAPKAPPPPKHAFAEELHDATRVAARKKLQTTLGAVLPSRRDRRTGAACEMAPFGAAGPEARLCR